MLLSERIENEYIVSYKAKDTLRRSVLRLVKTAAKNKQVELLRPLTEEELLEVIIKQAKQRSESIEQYRQAGRTELADKEEAELVILRDYMPKALSQEELVELIKSTIAQVQAKDIKDMGKVMAVISTKYKGQFDGKVLSEQVKSMLSA